MYYHTSDIALFIIHKKIKVLTCKSFRDRARNEISLKQILKVYFDGHNFIYFLLRNPKKALQGHQTFFMLTDRHLK